MTISLDDTCAWNIDAHRGRQLVAFGLNGACHVYHIKRQLAKKVAPKSAPNGNRKGQDKESQPDNKGNVYQRQAILQTDSKNFQKGVKFSPDGLKLACAGSDG